MIPEGASASRSECGRGRLSDDGSVCSSRSSEVVLHLGDVLHADAFVDDLAQALHEIGRRLHLDGDRAGKGIRPGRSSTVAPNGGANDTGNTLIRVRLAQPVTSAARSPRVANSAVSWPPIATTGTRGTPRSRDQRSARPRGQRPGPNARRRAGPPRQGRQAARGWNGPPGVGTARAVAHDPRHAPRRRRLVCAPRANARPAMLARRIRAQLRNAAHAAGSAADSRLINGDTRPPYRCPVKVSRWS